MQLGQQQTVEYAQRLADGLAIPQSREQLGIHDMAFVAAGEIRAAPDYVNQQWVRRYDMRLVLRRKITRTFQVLNLLSAGGSIEAEDRSRARTVAFSLSSAADT